MNAAASKRFGEAIVALGAAQRGFFYSETNPRVPGPANIASFILDVSKIFSAK